MAFPIASLTELLFGNVQNDRLQGVEIWSDRSAAGIEPFTQPEVKQIQVIPQNINFVQRSRISEQVIKDGRAFFFWRKDANSNHLDLLEIQMTGLTRSLAREPKRLGGLAVLKQTVGAVTAQLTGLGNLAPGNPPPLEDAPTKKQQEWMRLWRITREPYVIANAPNGINEHHIRLNTPALPNFSSGVQFIGHFTAPIQFSEVADNPFLVQWQLGLIVHRTSPTIDELFRRALTIVVKDPGPPPTPSQGAQPVASGQVGTDIFGNPIFEQPVSEQSPGGGQEGEGVFRTP